MESAVEALEDNKVKLSITVDRSEFDRDIDEAFRKIAREVKIPGFRAGKAPRKVLEARIGTEAGREQALRDALPQYYAAAVAEHEVDVISPPEIDITGGESDGDVTFDAVVEVRPDIVVAGYSGLSVTIADPRPTDEEIDGQIDRLRRQLGSSLEDAERPAIDGDHVTIDITTTRAGEQIDALTADDYVYEVGSGGVVPELDTNLHGTTPGSIVAFDADAPDEGDPLSFRVLVKAVRKLVLPELTDAWVADVTEFESVQQLRVDLAERIGAHKRQQATGALREQVVETVTGLVDDDEVPEAMVASEMESRLHDLAHRLQHQGIEMGEYLQRSGTSQDEMVAQLREVGTQAVKADLALRAIAAAESITVDDDELTEQVEQAAAQQEVDAAELRRRLERDGRLVALRSELMKAGALDWLVEHAAVVDEDGNPIDRDVLRAPDAEVDAADGDTESGADADRPTAAAEPSEEPTE